MTVPWYSDSGAGEPLVVLHPGGTDSRAMALLCEQLPEYRRILIDRPGHGRSADTDGAWSFAAMADAVADVLDSLGVTGAHVAGWSDGSIVGLRLALRRPDLVRSLVFGGAVFDVDGWRPGVLEGEPPQFMADSYAELSPDGRGHWRVVVQKSAALHAVEPRVTAAELRGLALPVLVVAGDDDEVRFEHLVELYETLPDAELAIVPRATHGLIVEKPALLADLIREFHRPDRGDGVAPLRRTHG